MTRQEYERRAPRCPECGYTRRDVREQMDHRFCGRDSPPPLCDACDDCGCDVCRVDWGINQ